ncbi:MAG: gliding motility-associated C-terminal domain-containing protein [Saprospiraceae bacterium]|nr:gliding motility-associated C-terminal domain-containing protein [Saprospiraceae bacterium]
MKKIPSFLFFLFLISPSSYAQFQRIFGTSLDNSFTKVIQHGTNYYVLGQDETTDGTPQRATITRLNASGTHVWTLGLDIASTWNDAVLTPNGDLLVVGLTLPFDANNRSLMGLVTSNGVFTWLKSYNAPGKESFNRIVKNPLPANPAFPYYILGTQNETSGMTSTKEVVLLNVDATGLFNWKKRFVAQNAFVTAGVSRDLEALPNGDLLMAGGGANGTIFRMNNSGTIFNGVQMSSISFTDIAQKSNGGFYASANDMSGSNIPHIIKFDQNLNPLWDVGIPKLTSINQIWESAAGTAYVTGRGSFGGSLRDVVIKIADNNAASLTWLKYLNSGSSFSGGSSWLLTSGQIAYIDSRIISGGFGQTCAFISVSNAELNTCLVSQDAANLISFGPAPDGPVLPITEFFDFPTGVNLTSQSLNWQQAEVCNTSPCTVDFSFQIKCGQVNFTSTTNLTGNPTILWNFGTTPPSTSTSFNPTYTYISNGTYNVCVTISGNGTSCQLCRNVTISNADMTPPVFVCPQNTVINTIPGQCYSIFSPVISVTDACFADPICNCVMTGATTGNMAKNTNIQFNKGITTVKCTATDGALNSSMCTFNVTVIDTQKPSIQCPPDKVLNCGSSTDISLTGIATATDNCPGVLTAYTDVVSGTKCNQIITRTWKSTDASGNTVTCQQVITLIDNVNPVIICPTDKILACNGSITPANTGTATATDNCQTNVTITFADVISGNACNQIISRTWTARDSCGNMSSCVQKITKTDQVAPVIICPTDKVTTCNGDISPAITGMATATDNCQTNVTITFADVNTGNSCNQIISRTWTARDSCGNAASCVQKITKTDQIAPVISCPTDKVTTCNGDISPAITGMATATDNCQTNVTITFADVNSGNSCNQIISRTWTARDSCGNMSSCVQKITKTDQVAPVIICPTDKVTTCNGNISPAITGMATATDNCQTNVTITFADVNTGNSCNQIISRTWTARDSCGNMSSCVQKITKTDQVAPVIICPTDKVTTCNGNISPAITGTATATDNCQTNVTITFADVNTGNSCNQIISRTWTARDSCGNMSSCVQKITKTDQIPPVISCPTDKVTTCNGDISPAITGTATATDNCQTNVTITFADVNSGNSCNQIISRTWTARDSCGNVSSCVQKITKTDQIAPVISCPTDKIVVCNGDISPANTGTATATDNCQTNVTITFADVISGNSCNQVISRTWTARDSCGNVSSCVQKITKTDTDPPVIVNCNRKIVIQGILSNQGKCEAFLTLDSPKASDLCSQNVTLSNSVNGTSNASGIYKEGITVINWTATDACGLKAFCKDSIVVLGCAANVCCKDSAMYPDKVKKYVAYTLDGCNLCFQLKLADSCEHIIIDFGDQSPLQLYSGLPICHHFDSESDYDVCLSFIRFDASGRECIRLDTCLIIPVLCPDLSPCIPSEIIVPNGLSPNGDNINDILKIKAPPECDKIDISVYNRWGQLVWIQADYDNTWAGQSLNGQLLPDGTYYIIVSATKDKNKTMIFKTFFDIRTK